MDDNFYIEDVDDEVLLAEFNDRGLFCDNCDIVDKELAAKISKLYEAYTSANYELFDIILRDVFYDTIGRIVP